MKFFPSIPLATVRIPEKGPLVSRVHLLKDRRANAKARQSPLSRFIRSPNKLATIVESPHEEDEGVEEQRASLEPSRDLHRAIDALGREDGRLGRIQDSEDEEMEWDEETTLVAMLQDKSVSISRI